MGFNSTLVINNDGIHDIAKDPAFGEKVSDAIAGVTLSSPVSISCGGACAAKVIETHHSSHIVPVMVGGCTGVRLPCALVDPSAEPLQMLKAMASAMGYTLRKKRS